MAPGRKLADRSIPSKDSRHSWDGHSHDQNISSISEIASQDYDNSSVISGQYDQDSGIEEVPRGEWHPETTAERAPQTGGIKFDRLNSTSALTRTVPPVQGHRDEVQKRGIDPIQPLQSSEEQAKTALRLRLDLNLDVEVNLKASIRGDVTLSLLA